MGTWGVGTWDSDDALDFLGDLGKKPRKKTLLFALAHMRDPEHAEIGLGGVGVRALCAVDLLAIAAGKLPARDGLTFDWTPTDDELALAVAVTENVAIYSELAALWDEAKSYGEWITDLNLLRAALGAPPLALVRPTFESKIPKPATADDLELAIDAMHHGVLRASLFRRDITTDDAGLALFARAMRPLVATDPIPAAEPMTVMDQHRLGSYPLHTRDEERILKDTKLATHYYLDNLAPALFRAARCALIAGSNVMARDRFARDLLAFVELLGGDAEAGVLTLISGREVDDDGSFGRALAFVHACAVWSVATLESSKSAPHSISDAAPLLVLARFRTRLRALWEASLDLEAPRPRFPSWKSIPTATLAAVSKRADALADFLTSIEAPGTTPARLPAAAPGSLVLAKKRGVTIALAPKGPQLLVARFGQRDKPHVLVASSFVTPLAPPPGAGTVFLGLPTDLPKSS